MALQVNDLEENYKNKRENVIDLLEAYIDSKLKNLYVPDFKELRVDIPIFLNKNAIDFSLVNSKILDAVFGSTIVEILKYDIEQVVKRYEDCKKCTWSIKVDNSEDTWYVIFTCLERVEIGVEVAEATPALAEISVE